jgi:hypothetical protein
VGEDKKRRAHWQGHLRAGNPDPSGQTGMGQKGNYGVVLVEDCTVKWRSDRKASAIPSIWEEDNQLRNGGYLILPFSCSQPPSGFRNVSRYSPRGRCARTTDRRSRNLAPSQDDLTFLRPQHVPGGGFSNGVGSPIAAASPCFSTRRKSIITPTNRKMPWSPDHSQAKVHCPIALLECLGMPVLV